MADESILRNIQVTGDSVVAQPMGEVGFARSPVMRTELIELVKQHKPKRLVLDMSEVPYMDSSGVATLVEAMQLQRHDGNKLVLCQMSDRVRSVFEISRLDMVFTIVPDLDSALKA